MDIHLIVLSPFGGYATGDRITDAAEIERHAESQHVVRVAAPTPTEKQEG